MGFYARVNPQPTSKLYLHKIEADRQKVRREPVFLILIDLTSDQTLLIQLNIKAIWSGYHARSKNHHGETGTALQETILYEFP